MNLLGSDATITNCKFINNWDGHLGINNTDNAKFINCMFLDHYEEAHPIYVDNGPLGILLTV